MGNPITPLTPAQVNYAQTAQFKVILKQALFDLRVAIPCIVQSFDPGPPQAVSVQVAITERIQALTGISDIAIPVINNVPVSIPSSGGYSITLPIKAGDEGLLVFCDMCIDLWWTRGGVQAQFEKRRHDLSDCVFISGLKSTPNAIANYSTNSMQIRSDDGTVVIDVKETGITITSPKVTINTTGDVDITATGNVNFQGKNFLLHEHTGVSTGGGVSGPVA